MIRSIALTSRPESQNFQNIAKIIENYNIIHGSCNVIIRKLDAQQAQLPSNFIRILVIPFQFSWVFNKKKKIHRRPDTEVKTIFGSWPHTKSWIVMEIKKTWARYYKYALKKIKKNLGQIFNKYLDHARYSYVCGYESFWGSKRWRLDQKLNISIINQVGR